MAREYDLKPAPSDAAVSITDGATTINRRQFLRYGFNTAAGVLTASIGMLGFAAILLPPGGGGGGDLAVQFWAKGREDEAWYGAKHLQPMTKPTLRLKQPIQTLAQQVQQVFGTECLSS